MSDPNRIVVPLSEQVSQQIDRSSIYLYDLSFFEVAVGTSGGGDGTQFRVQLQPRSITLSPNGRELIIEPPVINRSIKYLVEIGPAVQDPAGNVFDVDGTPQTLFARANYFAQTEPLKFNTTYTFNPELAAKVVEYTINIDRDDVLIWSGDRTVEIQVAMSCMMLMERCCMCSYPRPRADLALLPYRLIGQSLRAYITCATIDLPAAMGMFRVYRASQLPELPDSHIVTESDNWPLDFYKANLTAGDRVYFESLSVIRTMPVVFNPLGERITLSAIQATDQVLDVALSGEYIFSAWRIDFELSFNSGECCANTTGLIEGQLNLPGQRQQVSFVTVPGEVYALDASGSDPGNRVRRRSSQD